MPGPKRGPRSLGRNLFRHHRTITHRVECEYFVYACDWMAWDRTEGDILASFLGKDRDVTGIGEDRDFSPTWQTRPIHASIHRLLRRG